MTTNREVAEHFANLPPDEKAVIEVQGSQPDEVTIHLVSSVYDGLKVTVSGTVNSVANWIHENIHAGKAALGAGKIDWGNGIEWQHDDDKAIESLCRQLREGSPIAAYEDDCYFEPVRDEI